MTQQQALALLKMGKNVFLTGAAGSGKTYVLNSYIKYLKKHKIIVAVTASTGIAATHMNGKTIHSWAKIGIKEHLSSTDLQNIFKNKDYRQSISEAKVLIIDEISMLHHFRLDMVDAVLRKIHGTKDKPFGGIQVVLCGDLFQLPPVSRGGNSRYVTDSDVWSEMDIHVCYLTEQYRQNDDTLSQILNEIRLGGISQQSKDALRQRFDAKIDLSIRPTRLFTHNVDVDVINQQELNKLSGKSRYYNMTYKGDKSLTKTLVTNCLAPESLELKKGALVMFIQNNYSKGYVNGTLGEVVKFESSGMPVVKTSKGQMITVSIGSWMIEDGEAVLAEIKQLPLRLAWAITVHKSQGMTLDAAEIDLSKSFVSGMGYVALSRVRSLKTLSLKGFNNRALNVDPQVLSLSANLMDDSDYHANNLALLSDRQVEQAHQEFIKSLNYSGILL